MLIAARGDSPYLTSVTAAYLPRNLRPRVTSITIHPPGTVFQRPFPVDPEIAGFEGDLPERRAAAAQGGTASPPSLGRRAYQKGLLTIVWRAEDDNRDDLTYDVLYRREGETSWKALKRGDERSHPGVGHLVGPERPLLRARRRVGYAVELTGDRADRRDGEHVVRHRQHAADDYRDVGPPRRRRA